MNRDELASLIDHSVLKPEATEADVRAGAELVRKWRIGYYCVQPCWVGVALAALAGSDARVVSVIGFPHGCAPSVAKAVEASLALEDGARELDMVMNFGALRSGAHQAVAADIAAVVELASGATVKVILETGALTDDEKRLACRIARDAGARFAKTSTGFHPSGGATIADVRLMRETVGAALGIKASGGVRTLADALALIEAGANRIGTSASATILAALAEA